MTLLHKWLSVTNSVDDKHILSCQTRVNDKHNRGMKLKFEEEDLTASLFHSTKINFCFETQEKVDWFVPNQP